MPAAQPWRSSQSTCAATASPSPSAWLASLVIVSFDLRICSRRLGSGRRKRLLPDADQLRVLEGAEGKVEQAALHGLVLLRAVLGGELLLCGRPVRLLERRLDVGVDPVDQWPAARQGF